MTDPQRSPMLPKRLTVVLIYCVYIQAGNGAYSSVTSNTCRKPTDDERYRNLFVGQTTIERFVHNRYLENVFKITRVKSRYEFEGICPSKFSARPTSRSTLPACAVKSTESGDPCCETSMWVTVPYEVTSIYTGETYLVKHFGHLYQLLHQAECASLGSPCAHSGTCQLKYRIQWILAVLSDNSEKFVPVSIPNHCYCQYH